MTNTRLSLLTVAALLTVPLGCDPDTSDEPIDSDARLAHEIEAEDDEDVEDVTVDYYGTQLVMSDLEDTEVHCVASDAVDFRCFDTIEEADAVHVPAADSLTAAPDHQASHAFCRFFEHSSYGGSSVRYDLWVNKSNLGLSGWNDRISSIECVSAKARVYENISYGGDTKDSLTTSYVGNLWNDQISSLKVISP
jgi:hypothetical protein